MKQGEVPHLRTKSLPLGLPTLKTSKAGSRPSGRRTAGPQHYWRSLFEKNTGDSRLLKNTGGQHSHCTTNAPSNRLLRNSDFAALHSRVRETPLQRTSNSRLAISV